MGLFESLEKSILGLVIKKLKVNSLSVSQLTEMCDFQINYLTDIKESLERFDEDAINALRDKYFAQTKRKDRIDNQHILLDLKTRLEGKAGLYERKRAFGAALKAADAYLKIAKEVKKGAAQVIGEKYIKIKGARMTDIMLLGMLREMDVFTRYTGYLFEYFRIVIGNKSEQDLYRARYLADYQDQYMQIVSDICDKQNNYSFLDDIKIIKRKNADLVLYANGMSFLSFLDPRNYTKSDHKSIEMGILGLPPICLIFQAWTNWKHAQYKKVKIHKEWLEHEHAALMQEYMTMDPNSEQAIQNEKYREAYSKKINELDREIAEYEEDR